MDKNPMPSKPSLSRSEFLKLWGVGVGSALSLVIGSPAVDPVTARRPISPQADPLQGSLSGRAFARPLLSQDFADTIRSTGRSDPATGVGIEINYDSATATGNILAIDRTADPDVYKALSLSGLTIQLNTNASERIRIDSDGEVGIGTTNPLAKLHVVGEVRIVHTSGEPLVIQGSDNIGARISIQSTATGGRRWDIGGTANGASEGSGKFIIRDGTASATIFTIDSDGEVGIATTSPLARLHVVDSLSEPVIIEGSNTIGARLSFKSTATGGRQWHIGGTANGAGEGGGKFIIRDSTASATRVTVNSSGDVGIGTTTPAGKLDVAGNIRTTNGYIDLQGAAGATGLLRSHPSIAGIELGSLSNSPLWFITNSTEKMRITGAGDVGIGITSPTAKLQVNGQIAIKDGMAAPSTISGYAQMFVDSADGDLKVKFGDGTVKTIVTDT